MKYRSLTFSATASLGALLSTFTPLSAQSILKTAGNYSALAGQAITVAGTGFTLTNGNIGLFPAATSNITGFPPGTVTGTTLAGTAAAIIATGGATQQAEADLQVAATGLAAMPLTANYTNVDMANLGPLPPGVYKWNAAATLTGALVLDAQGKNNVFWVFQFGTGLTTAVNSSVTVINRGSNGGGDDGIFWNAATGAIVIGNNNTILGNYIAYTSVSFTGSTLLLGSGGARFLALNAAVTFAGPGSLNPLGGSGGSDWTGGLKLNGSSVVATAVGPTITSPITAAGTGGTSFSYTITAAGPVTSYSATGLPAGLTLNSTTGVISGTPVAAGTSLVTIGVISSTGTTYSVLTLTVGQAGSTPVIVGPTAAPGTVGTPVTFPITATGLPTSYTATGLPPGLTLNPLTGAISGTPTTSGTFSVQVTATNSAGTSSSTVTFTIAAAAPYARIANFSARAVSGPGNQAMVLGFVVAGNGKNLLVRGVGPSLAAFGITNPLGDPVLTLYGSGGAIATNNGWQTTSGGLSQSALVTTTDAQVGAYALAGGSADAALMATVNQGSFTTNLLSPNGTSGVALTEIYDTDVTPNPVARLINVSALMNAGAGQNTLIAGLVIVGNIPQTVLIRGDGPALASFGVAGVMPDPQIAVFSGNTQIAANASWGTGPSTAAQLSAAAALVGAFPLTSGSKDSALLLTLQPGAYSVEVTSVSGATGLALIEIYDTQ